MIEAEAADQVQPSMISVRDPAASGGLCLTIPEGAGSGAFDSGVGSAQYQFHVDNAGEYDIWTRVLWESGCSNSFRVTLDGELVNNLLYSRNHPAIGKDSTLITWHWVRHLRVELTAGDHVLTIHNQDDGSSFDQFIVTNDREFRPVGMTPWFYNRDFDDGDSTGWQLSENWTVMDGALQRTAGDTGDLRLTVEPVATWYWSGEVQASEFFEIGTEPVAAGAWRLRWQAGALKLTAGDAETATGDLPAFDGRLEVWRQAESLHAALDGVTVLSAALPKSSPATFRLDAGSGTRIDNVETAPYIAFHVGANYYSQWYDFLIEPESGEWQRNGLQDCMELRSASGIASFGESWWRDYQLAFLFSLPANGVLEVGVYGRSATDSHVLRLTHDPLTIDLQELLRQSGNASTPLAPAQSVPLKHDWNLCVINVLGDRLQVYVNDTKLFDVRDPSLAGGRVYFQGENAAGMLVDDIDLWQLTEMPPEGEWPSLRGHEALPARVLHSPMDNWGAVGAPRPGYVRRTRQETELRWLMSNHVNDAVPERARVIDYQWSTFGPAFEERYGEGRKQGWILARSTDPDAEHLLWATENAMGDWQFSFRSHDVGEALGVVLYPWPPDLTQAPPKPLRIWVEPRRDVLRIGRDEESAMTIKLASRWRPDAWYDWHLQAVDDELRISIGGTELHRMPLAELGTMLRPALFFRHGRIYFDDLNLTLEPDLNYRFDFNYPLRLTMAGWDTNGYMETDKGKPRFDGGYYCRMHLHHPSDHVFLRCRRSLTGPATITLHATTYESQSLTLTLLSAADGSPLLTLRRLQDCVDAWHGQKRLGQAAIALQDGQSSSLDAIRVDLRDGFAEIYLSDEVGSDRLALRVELPTDLLSQPYYLQFDAEPRLIIKNVLIWND